MSEPTERDGRKAVGIYDRPASADRPRYLRIIVIVIALLVALAGLYVALA